VAYQDTASETRQRVALLGDTWEARCRRAKRKTLSFVIPKGAYDSTAATLEFENDSGPYAAIAEIKVFEFATPPASDGGGEQSAGATPLRAGGIELVVAPNPFTAGTRLSFELQAPVTAALTVCDVSGRVVRRLGSFARPSGSYQVWFDGRDAAGRHLVPGIYFVELRTGKGSACRKVILTR